MSVALYDKRDSVWLRILSLGSYPCIILVGNQKRDAEGDLTQKRRKPCDKQKAAEPGKMDEGAESPGRRGMHL